MIKDDKKKTHIIALGKGGGGGSDAGAVRFDEAQTLTSAEQLQARENIGVPTEWFGTQAEYDLIDPKDPDTVYHIEGGQPVQSDWNENDNTSLAYIQNKPTIPAAQVNADWNSNSGVSEILNKPSTETLTFTLQGGTTVTLDVYVAPQLP